MRVEDGFILLYEVPYLSAPGLVSRSVLAAPLTLAGEATTTPQGHQVRFVGEFPLDEHGAPHPGVGIQAEKCQVGRGLVASFHLSCKLPEAYKDYHEMLTTYVGVLAAPARLIDPNANARVFRPSTDDDEDSPFHYTDNASARAGIGALINQLRNEKVAIVGMGGTGTYILDLVAKTPVAEIRLFDDDLFLQHNAFRAPGAPSLEELREAPLKVRHFAAIYSRMNRRIISHEVALSVGNVHLLDDITFAFLSMDPGESKRAVVSHLEAQGASFIDVGMGLDLVDERLGGILRITTSTPQKRSHVHDGRISFAEPRPELYESNIQIADLNMLNAALAVHKWKKLRGFYDDAEHEHHSTFTTDGNQLCNSDFHASDQDT